MASTNGPIRTGVGTLTMTSHPARSPRTGRPRMSRRGLAAGADAGSPEASRQRAAISGPARKTRSTSASAMGSASSACMRGRVLAEFAHVAEDGDAPAAAAWLGLRKQRQRRTHRQGIGVIALVNQRCLATADEQAVARPPPLRRLNCRQRQGCLGEIAAEDGDSSEDGETVLDDHDGRARQACMKPRRRGCAPRCTSIRGLSLHASSRASALGRSPNPMTRATFAASASSASSAK